jgi:WD40 repeat protein
VALGQWDGSVQLWDLASEPKLLTQITLPTMKALCFSSDGKRLWGLSGDVKVWSWTEGDAGPRQRFDNTVEDWLSGNSGFVSLAAGRDFVLLGGRSGDLHYAGDRGGEPKHWRLDAGPITSVALAPSEDLVACGTEDGQVRLLTSPSGDPVATLAHHNGPVGSVDFSSDGRLLASASQDGRIRLWQRQARRWEQLLTLRLASAVLQARFHPQQPLLAIQLQGEPAIRILDLDALEASLDALDLGWTEQPSAP